jgi:hypothetical protein
MTRRRTWTIAGLGLISVAGAYQTFLLYAANVSFSVPDSANVEYYAHFARLWGAATLILLSAAVACAVILWRGRSRVRSQ